MIHEVRAARTARVAGVLVREGEPVAPGQPLVWLDESVRPPWAVGRGRRDRRMGTASVSLRMSPDSISSSAGDSSAKSLPASRSVALAITRRAVCVSSSGPGS